MEPVRTSILILLIIVALIDLVLKGFALWKSARRGQTVWFVVLLILNTAGILPAIYLLVFSKKVKR